MEIYLFEIDEVWFKILRIENKNFKLLLFIFKNIITNIYKSKLIFIQKIISIFLFFLDHLFKYYYLEKILFLVLIFLKIRLRFLY